MTNHLLATFVLLQLADIYTTHRILKGGGVERNPLLCKLFDRFGVLPVLLVTKAVAVAAVIAALTDYPWVVGGLDVFYAVVIANNLRILK